MGCLLLCKNFGCFPEEKKIWKFLKIKPLPTGWFLFLHSLNFLFISFHDFSPTFLDGLGWERLAGLLIVSAAQTKDPSYEANPTTCHASKSLIYQIYFHIFGCFIFLSQFFCWDSCKMFSEDGTIKKSASFWQKIVYVTPTIPQIRALLI